MSPSPRFFRYLPRNTNGSDWGASVLDAGNGTVPPDSEYPLPGHPEDHEFTWEKGRCLGAYTFVYITAGHGVFDSEPSGEVAVPAGSVFLVFPASGIDTAPIGGPAGTNTGSNARATNSSRRSSAVA